MATPMSSSSASIISGNGIPLQEEFVMATLLDLHKHKNVWNNLELSDFFDSSFHANTLKTHAFCAALDQHLNNHQSLFHEGDQINYHELFHDLACVYRQELALRDTLQFYGNSFDEKLDRINYWKKASAVFCTAAAATSAAAAAANANPKRAAVGAAAAAASILFGELRSRLHSFLKKKESGVKKHKEIIRVMIMGAKISIKDLTNFMQWLAGCSFRQKSMSEIIGDDVDARKRSFQELVGQANDYRRDICWARTVVVQTIIKLFE